MDDRFRRRAAAAHTRAVDLIDDAIRDAVITRASADAPMEGRLSALAAILGCLLAECDDICAQQSLEDICGLVQKAYYQKRTRGVIQ